MNFFNKLLLQLVLSPKFLYRNIGADPRHLKLILTAKLTMDDRRPNTFHQTRRKTTKQISASTIGTMFFSFLFGLFFLFGFVTVNDRVTQFAIYFSMYITMLSITLISDFTSVLIDVRDNYIILTKPVTDKTFVISRLLHIFIHLIKVVLPMVLPALVYIAIYTGAWGAAVLLLLVLLSTVFSIFLINAIYLLVLKFSTPAKFQNIISYIQILVAIVSYASYQIVPRFARSIQFSDYSIGDKPWAWLLPSYWFAAGWEFFYTLNMRYVAGGLLAVLVPPITLWIVTKYFAPSFNQKLSQITGSSEETPVSKSRQRQSVWSMLKYKLAAIFTRRGEERMSFLLTWNLTSRSREFRLKVYPSIGYMVVYFAVMAANRTVSLDEIRMQTRSSRMTIIGIIYIGVLVISIALEQIQYSDRFKAAWIYYTAPVRSPGNILAGAFKATILKFLLPISILFLVSGVGLIGVQILPNLILGILNVLLSCILIGIATVNILPFSKGQSNAKRAGSFIRGIVSMIVPLFFAVLQYFVYNAVWGLLLCSVLSGIASWLLMDYVKNKNWTRLYAAYEE